MRYFKLHWKSSRPNIISIDYPGTQREALASAMNKAGIGAGALGALDYWEEIKSLRIDADPNCPYCAGKGKRTWNESRGEFWGAPCIEPMGEDCDCVLSQLPADFEGKFIIVMADGEEFEGEI